MSIIGTRIGAEPLRTCLRCGGGPYREHSEGCAHAYTLEELAPAPRIIEAMISGIGERTFVASNGPADLVVAHPTEEGARRLFAERWVWGRALTALFGWLHARPRASVFGAVARAHQLRRQALEAWARWTLDGASVYETLDEFVVAMCSRFPAGPVSMISTPFHEDSLLDRLSADASRGWDPIDLHEERGDA